MKRFQEMFIDAGSDAIDFDGAELRSIVRREIGPGTSIDIEFLQARGDPPQGLELAVDGGTLAWDEHNVEGSAVRLWADKQSQATIRYASPRKSTQLSVWNIWLDRSGGSETVQAWWAWSGMRVEASDDELFLRCSGNYTGADFGDLVARLEFRPTA